jgi:glycosyltransferase involved in cell wall biosynthesis
MRICFIGDARSVHTQRWVLWFAEHHDVALIATQPDPALAEHELAGLPATSRVPGTRLAHSAMLTRRAVRAYRPDVVHAHYINEAGWLAAASGARPFVISAWGSDLYRAPQESAVARRLNPWAARRADFVTCDSEDQARLLRAWGVPSDRVGVIGWGVDRSEFNPEVDGGAMRDTLDIPREADVILSPRQWLANSNIEAIVAAHALVDGEPHLVLKRLPRHEPDGGRAVLAAVAASPARDRVHLVEEIDAAALPSLYAAADVVVSLCVTDGTPMSVLEAMATGRAVVAFRNESLAEWVAPPGGRLVSSTAPGEVAAAISGFLNGSAGDREAVVTHNVETVAERADRAAEMRRMDAVYARLGSGRAAVA